MGEQHSSAEFARARTLAHLVPHFSEADRPRAWQAARNLHDAGARVRALCNLVNTLPSDQRGGVLAEAVTLARSIDQPWLRVRALVPVLLRLPASQKTAVAVEVLETIKLIPHEWHRGRALMLAARSSTRWDQRSRRRGSSSDWGAVRSRAGVIDLR